MKNIDKIRNFSEAIENAGLSAKNFNLPKPSLSISNDPSESEIGDDYVFEKLIKEPEIYDVSRDLFVSQFYNNSVQEAFTALDNYIKARCSKTSSSGTGLMREVFNPKSPLLVFSQRDTQSEVDENDGYGHLFAGAMQGIRNPTSHEYQWIVDRETALECLILCQHLLRKAKTAHPPPT